MLDIKDVRDRPDYYRERLGTRAKWMHLFVDDLLFLYQGQILCDEGYQYAQQERKRVQKKNMSEGDIEYAKWLKQDSDNWSKWADEYREKLNDLLMKVPNIPHDKCPIGMVSMETEDWEDHLRYILLTNKI